MESSQPRKRRSIVCGYCKSIIIFTSKTRHFERKHPGKPLYWTEHNACDNSQPSITDVFRPKSAKTVEFGGANSDKTVTIDENEDVEPNVTAPSRKEPLPRPQPAITPTQPIIVTGAYSTVQVSFNKLTVKVAIKIILSRHTSLIIQGGLI